MNWTWLILMFAAAFGMVVGRKKYREGVDGGKPVTVLCGILVVVFAVTSLFVESKGKVDIQENLQAYRLFRAKKLGAYLGESTDVSAVLIVVEPGTFPEKQIEALKEGMAPGAGVLDIAELNKTEKQTKEAEILQEEQPEQWFTAQVMDQTIAEYVEECDVVVSFPGMPQNIGDMETLTKEEAPQFAVLRDGRRYIEAIRAGVIVAAVDRKQGAGIKHLKSPPPPDLKEAFKESYVLLTQENI